MRGFPPVPGFDGPTEADHLPLLAHHDRTKRSIALSFYAFIHDVRNRVNLCQLLHDAPSEVAIGLDTRRDLVTSAMKKANGTLRCSCGNAEIDGIVADSSSVA